MKVMSGRMSKRESDELLDRLGREVLRVAASNDEEAEAVAASPFLYARVRSRIASERARREEGERWLALLGVVWRAAPALALVAVLAVALFLSASVDRRTRGGFSVESLIGTSDATLETVVFADNRALSSDEVLATIINEDETENSR